MNPLDEVWAWYEAARDSMRTVRLMLETPLGQIPEEFTLKDSVFALQPRDTALSKLKQAQAELDALTIVALFATFEQQLFDHFEEVVRKTRQSARDPLRRRILRERLKKPRYWGLEEILDLYKAMMEPRIVGLIKQIYQYRNWVAHGRKGASPPNITPEMAYKRLKEFLESL